MDKISHLPTRGDAPIPALLDMDELAGLEMSRARMALFGLRDILESMAPGTSCDPHHLSALIDCIGLSLPDDDIDPED